MNRETQTELEVLLSLLCDQGLDARDKDRLDFLLRDDPECRRLYLEYLDLHARMTTHPRMSAGLPSPLGTVLPISACDPGRSPGVLAALGDSVRKPARPWLRHWLRHAAVLALLSLAAALFLQFVLLPSLRGRHDSPSLEVNAPEPPVSEYVATLVGEHDCTWSFGTSALPLGTRLPTGSLGLGRGVAEIRFDNGVTLVLEGPARVCLDSGNAATLLQGKLVFRRSPSDLRDDDSLGGSFDLRTPQAVLNDLGTEYAVAISPEGCEDIHVLDGEVERRVLQSKTGLPLPPQRLVAGEARQFLPNDAVTGQPVPLDETRFVRQAPMPLQVDPAAGLLAYEGFDYRVAALPAREANGGEGWAEAWQPPASTDLGDNPLLGPGLTWPGAKAPGLCLGLQGALALRRRLAKPIRLDQDGVYYVSFLIQRQAGPSDPPNVVVLVLRDWNQEPRTKIALGLARAENLAVIFLEQGPASTPVPLDLGQTYAVVAKICASRSLPEQVFLRVYKRPEEITRREPAYWSVVSRTFASDAILDTVVVHVKSQARQLLDEIRIGTTWESVTATLWGPEARAQ